MWLHWGRSISVSAFVCWVLIFSWMCNVSSWTCSSWVWHWNASADKSTAWAFSSTLFSLTGDHVTDSSLRLKDTSPTKCTADCGASSLRQGLIYIQKMTSCPFHSADTRCCGGGLCVVCIHPWWEDNGKAKSIITSLHAAVHLSPPPKTSGKGGVDVVG